MAFNKHYRGPRRPNKVNAELTKKLRDIVEKHLIATVPDWTIWATDTVRGRCSYTRQTVTVPKWAFNHQDGEAYVVYYICHEIAHILTPITKGDIHGAKFQAHFKMICPQEYWHYELNYKPRLARAAGIRKPS